MIDELMKIKETVEKILSEDQRACDDDKWLIVRVLRELGFKIYIDYEEMPSMPSWESITRCRRKFQEEGKYPASEECTRQRKKNEQEMEDINKTWKDTSDDDINKFW